MPDSIIDRSGAEALMPEDAAREIIQGAPQRSAVLTLGTRLPNMTRAQRRIPVLSSLPTAYFLNAGADPSDTSWKRTSRAAWSNKFIDAEELAVIVPIPEAVLDDADYDIWGQIRPLIEEALGAAIDGAVFFGANAPNVWPTALVPAATAAGNVTAAGTGADLYEDLLGEGGVISLVEENGYLPTGHVAAVTMRARLRGLRDQQGQPLFMRSLNNGQNMQESTRYELDGQPLIFPMNGAFDPAQALMVSGDYRQLVYAIRQDITTKLLTEAVIQDPATGEIVYNLAQQDMVALRVVMRLGWQVPNPITRFKPDEATRYPFAVLTPAAPAGGE